MSLRNFYFQRNLHLLLKKSLKCHQFQVYGEKIWKGKIMLCHFHFMLTLFLIHYRTSFSEFFPYFLNASFETYILVFFITFDKKKSPGSENSKAVWNLNIFSKSKLWESISNFSPTHLLLQQFSGNFNLSHARRSHFMLHNIEG